MNEVILSGRICTDVEVRYPPSGNGGAVASCLLAVDKGFSKEKREEAEANNKPTANFIGLKFFSKVVDSYAKYMYKGQKILVSGSISTFSFTNSVGVGRKGFEILVNRIELLEKRSSNGDESFADFQNYDYEVEF